MAAVQDVEEVVQDVQDECLEEMGTQGMRRWPKENIYYSFAQFLEYVIEWNLNIDKKTGEIHSFEAAALRLWKRGIDKELEEAEFQAELQRRAASVGELEYLPLEELKSGTAVVLEKYNGVTGACGNSLRATKSGWADFHGGSSWPSVVIAEISSDEKLARFRSLNGGYLRHFEHEYIDFRGTIQDGIDFEVLGRTSPTPLLTLAVPGGQAIGTFVPRRSTILWWRGPLIEETRMAVAAEPTLEGRRRHKEDPNGKLYTFEELVLYGDGRGWGGPITNGALALARLVWENSCVPEGYVVRQVLPAIEERRRHPKDTSGRAYTFEEWVCYIREEGWGFHVPDGARALATAMWHTDCILADGGEPIDWELIASHDVAEGNLAQ